MGDSHREIIQFIEEIIYLRKTHYLKLSKFIYSVAENFTCGNCRVPKQIEPGKGR